MLLWSVRLPRTAQTRLGCRQGLQGGAGGFYSSHTGMRASHPTPALGFAREAWLTGSPFHWPSLGREKEGRFQP